MATVALVTLDEERRALNSPHDTDFELRQSLLLPADPRDAAGAAAWQVLSGQQKAGPPHFGISFVTASGEEPPDLAVAVSHLQAAWKRPAVDEIRYRVEPGQGELWALLASPCGTAAEGAETAGYAALLVQELASNSHEVDGVALEPWISPDGIGLLAHGPRRGPEETAEAHAERVGDVLGRALSRPLSGREIARTRAEVRRSLGPGPRPGWWLAIDALAPAHPSWLEPRGTWQSVAEATTYGVAADRTHLVTGPLRLAVLANVNKGQAQGVAKGLGRWLHALRVDKSECSTPPRPASRPGRLELETSAGPGIAAAHVGVPITPTPEGLPEEAHYTLWLLNRPGGWLDRALRSPGLVAGARARLLGGRRVAALVVTLEAEPDQADQAVAQVRALFERLAQGAVSEKEFRQARREFARGAARSQLDPRRRAVALWTGGEPTDPTLRSLRAFHRGTFATDRHVVVVVKQND